MFGVTCNTEIFSPYVLYMSWKQSVIIPILKQSKPKSAINSYRPIALTSHAGKIMGKIILKGLLHYCVQKNDIVPANQAGFRKGRCTDHLVFEEKKYSGHIFLRLGRFMTLCGTPDYLIN